MMTRGRVAAIAVVTLGLGFVGGIWFVSTGVAFQLVPLPTVGPVNVAANPPPKAIRRTPLVEAVAVPKEASLISHSSGGLWRRADRTDLLPSPGCQWAIEPRPLQFSSHWQRTDSERSIGGFPTIDPHIGGLRYLLIQSTRQGAPPLELRPVFFDADANRHVPRRSSFSSSRGSGGEFSLIQFYLDPGEQLAPAKVTFFGIEQVTPDSARLLVVAAQAEAEKKGMAMMPPAQIGSPYPFDLSAADGKRVRSDDFRGKALLMAFCGPVGLSSAGLGWIKRIRETNKKDELAIVGVSFDGSVEDARESFVKSGAGGPLVVVPNDPTIRRIWSEGAQITHLPMFLLIDREGVLCFTTRNFFDLQDRIDNLFGRANRPILPKAVFRARPASRTPTAPAPPAGGPASPAPRPAQP